MDQDILVPKQNNSTLLTKRNILLVFAVVIVVEMAWAYKALVLSSPQGSAQHLVAAKPKPTTVTLTASNTTVKVGQKVAVFISLSSQRKVDGVDLIITYDPKLLSVEPAPNGSPVAVGTIFNDYPQNVVNKNTGRIAVSGITSSQEGVLGNRAFGSLVFSTRSAGQARISVVFTPGSTTDSNIIETKTGKDVLEQVKNLEINVIP